MLVDRTLENLCCIELHPQLPLPVCFIATPSEVRDLFFGEKFRPAERRCAETDCRGFSTLRSPAVSVPSECLLAFTAKRLLSSFTDVFPYPKIANGRSSRPRSCEGESSAASGSGMGADWSANIADRQEARMLCEWVNLKTTK